MTLALSYLDDLSRVRIEGTYPISQPNGSVTVEHARKADGPWSTVRGGADYAFNNESGLVLDGEVGNYADTPDDVSLDITGDIDVRADLTLDDWKTHPHLRNIIAKFDGDTDNLSYRLGVTGDGTPRFSWSTDGTGTGNTNVHATATVPINSGRLAVRATFDVDDGSGGWVVRFYTADTIDGPWTQLGDPVDNSGGGTTSIFAGSAALEVGSIEGGTSGPLDGIVHGAEVYDGIDGTRVAAPHFAEETDGATGFTDAEGRTWSINGSAEIDIVPQVVLDDYEFYADVPTHYRVRRTFPKPGLLLGGDVGDYASTPDDASLDITGDIDLRVLVAPDDWDSGSSQVFAAKRDSSAGEESWQFYVNSGGRINLAWWDSGQALSNVLGGFLQDVTGVADGEQIALRATLDVDDGSSQHVVTFWHSTSIDGPWDQLGSADVNSGTTSIFDSTADVEVGARDNGTENIFDGTIFAAEMYDGIDASQTLVADPVFADEADSATSFDDDAGNTWTVNGDARILGELMDTGQITARLRGKVWLKSIKYPNLNRPITIVDYTAIGRAGRVGVHTIKGRKAPIGTTDVRAAGSFGLTVTTELAADEIGLDITLASGGTMFVHTPAGTQIPGGYVVIGNTSDSRTLPSKRSERRLFDLPCTIVAQPAPQIVGATLTWGDVFELYGSWEALWAVVNAWPELWDQISSLDEPVEV